VKGSVGAYANIVGNIGSYEFNHGFSTSIGIWDQFRNGENGGLLNALYDAVGGRGTIGDLDQALLSKTESFMESQSAFFEAFKLAGSSPDLGFGQMLSSVNPQEEALGHLFLTDEALIGERMGYSQAALAKLNEVMDTVTHEFIVRSGG
jgi:hypothetical protein